VILMDNSQFLAAIERDGAAFRSAAMAAGLDADVPACPGWKVSDLIWHLAEVHYFWGTVVSQKPEGWKDVARIDRVPDDQLIEAFDLHFAGLLDVLSKSDPADEVWTWAADHSVGFVIRRMTHETAVHSWDAALAAARPIDIEAELASDGIDEFLEHFLPDVIEGAEPVGGSVHIHCGDVAGEWTIRPVDDGFEVTREHAKGDCALRGSANNLLLALWRRIGSVAIDVVGDADVARRFLAAPNLH
jgi:uncharacterized protein (TIGR03083 family)